MGSWLDLNMTGLQAAVRRAVATATPVKRREVIFIFFSSFYWNMFFTSGPFPPFLRLHDTDLAQHGVVAVAEVEVDPRLGEGEAESAPLARQAGGESAVRLVRSA